MGEMSGILGEWGRMVIEFRGGVGGLRGKGGEVMHCGCVA